MGIVKNANGLCQKVEEIQLGGGDAEKWGVVEGVSSFWCGFLLSFFFYTATWKLFMKMQPKLQPRHYHPFNQQLWDGLCLL